jgi:anti-anti-sigma factor
MDRACPTPSARACEVRSKVFGTAGYDLLDRCSERQQPGPPGAMVRLRSTVTNGVATIHIRGEVDLGNVEELGAGLHAAIAAGATSLIFDCGELSFIDSSGLGVLIETSHEISERGGSVMIRNPSALVRRLLERTQLGESLPIEAPELQPDLTARQREVLALLAQGASNAEIADSLFINTETVKSHLRNIFDKLGVKNRTQAARYASDHAP